MAIAEKKIRKLVKFASSFDFNDTSAIRHSRLDGRQDNAFKYAGPI